MHHTPETNSGPDTIRIRGGEFLWAATTHMEDARPVHRVHVGAFWTIARRSPTISSRNSVAERRPDPTVPGRQTGRPGARVRGLYAAFASHCSNDAYAWWSYVKRRKLVSTPKVLGQQSLRGAGNHPVVHVALGRCGCIRQVDRQAPSD